MSNSWLCLHSSNNEADLSSSTLPLDNRGLAYGDGFFTTMGVIDGKVLWLDCHHQRITSHAKALQLDLDSHAIITDLQNHAQRLQQGMLKLIVVRAVQEVRGYGYTAGKFGSACDIWLKSSKMMVATETQIRLADERFIPIQSASHAICLSSQIACLPPPLAGLKSLNRLDTVLASAELQHIKSRSLNSDSSHTHAQQNMGEGLLRDMSGCWIEGTMSNVFYQLADAPSSSYDVRPPLSSLQNISHMEKDEVNYLTTGQWYTPSLAQSGVAGVMRQVIIDTLSTTENPVIVRSLQEEDLPSIKQLFFCNALRGVMPMSSLNLLTGDVVTF